MKEAEGLYRQVALAKRRLFGDSDPRSVLALNNRGLLLLNQRRLHEAKPMLPRIYGPRHPKTLTAYNNLEPSPQTGGAD